MKAQHSILNENTYNIDKISSIIGIVGSSKIVFSKQQKQAFINQAGNQEQASLIKVIIISGCQLLLFIILKGKKWKNDWYPSDMKRIACISLNENGQTDNKLYLEWMRDFFKPETRSYLYEKYSILIVDRHELHVSNKFI